MMDAHELADKLQETEPYYSTDYKLFDNSANMLRQQADRIAELEKPHKYDPETGEPLIDGYPLFSGLPRPQTKPLTDEEIIAVGNAVVNHIDSNEGWIEFARAILRKAWD